MADGPVVMLTALNIEYEAVRDRLTDLRVHRHSAGTRFEEGRLRDGAGRVVLGLAGKGNHSAAVLTERAISEFAPVALLFVGVAGALWPSVGLGDVVVATHVYAYHGGTSEDDGMKARPRGWEIAHGPDQLARHVERSERWRRSMPAGEGPTVWFGPIAAGEVVQDSTVSAQARWIREHYNDALAIEMEAAGFAQAGHLNDLPVVVVRGISDRADGSKVTTDGVRWQPRAAANAAAFASALAAELIKEAAAGGPVTAGAAPTAVPPSGGSTWNIATGQATVGVQAGQMHGNVHIGSVGSAAPTDLATQLAALREDLRLAHRSGRLDEPTYAAAEQELDAASGALKSGTAQMPGMVTVALKKLGGLLADVTDLATKVTAILARARGLR